MIDFSLYGYELRNTCINMINAEYPDAQQTGKGYAIRCPVCGDNPRKKRGNFLLDREPYMYVCHNGDCDAGQGFYITEFMDLKHPEYKQQWINEVLRATRESEEKQRERKARVARERYMVERRVPTKKVTEDDPRIDIVNFKELIEKNGEHIKHFRSLLEYPQAIEWCMGRAIPHEVYKRWLYAPNGGLFGRIIIPFDDKDGNMYFYQARSIIGHEPKYRNAKTDIRPIYNYYQVDINKPVIVLEGPIDSEFVENSVATLGTKYNEELLEPFKQLYFIFDDDEAGRATALKHLDKGKYVFMWKKFIKNYVYVNGKVDFNDLAIQLKKSIFTFEELEPFFTNNVMMKMFL